MLITVATVGAYLTPNDTTLACDVNSSDYPGCGEGCTDPDAGNYDPTATTDDGSCTYPGCTDPNATNYDATAVGDDGSCEYDTLCEDPNATNYEDYGDCEYSYCCNTPGAKNFDFNCPDADAPTVEDNSICELCTKDSTDFSCEVYYCDENDDPDAINKESKATCDAANPNNPCISDRTECEFPQTYFCADNTTPALDHSTQSECDNSIPSYWPACIEDQSTCEYPTEDYCSDENANNYQTEDECKGGIAERDCVAHTDTPVCHYDNFYCNVDFALDIDCPGGFLFSSNTDEPYVYSRAISEGDECTALLTYVEQNYFEGYFEQLICGDGGSPQCTGDYCDLVDWCPNIEGVQTDPTDCLDVCTDANNPGIQLNQSECVVCSSGTCNPINGVCGSMNNTNQSSANNITGSNACSVGNIGYGGVTGPTNGRFNWSCLGVEGGSSSSCQANLDCGSGTYCNGICISAGQTCEPPNDCVNINFCKRKGLVTLDSRLEITTPIINKGGECVVNFDSTPDVFEHFDETTHCKLYNQDGLLTSFDPIYLNNDTIGEPSYPTTYTEANVSKDTHYILKCYDGPTLPTSEAGYEKAFGSCRLNLKTQEIN